MKKWTYTTAIYAGPDSLNRLDSIQDESIMIVCDPFMVGSETFESLVKRLQQKNGVTVYTDVVPDPPIAKVVAGIEFLTTVAPTIVLAIGGGSAIDLTKGILYFASKLNGKGRPYFIAIPTTSGTGSEVTSFAVITDPVNQIKYPLVDDAVLPDEALLTSLFVKSAPPKVTAYSGMDALVHALEALVSTDSDIFSDALAEKAITTVFEYLPRCYSANATETDRMYMHEASCMAGLAFNRVGLGITHAMAHQLGGQFHIPHGLANAILIAPVVTFNAMHNERALTKYAKISCVLGFASYKDDKKKAVIALVKGLLQLARTVECPMTVTEATGLDAAELKSKVTLLAEKALEDMTYKTNPCKATKEELINILLMVL